MISLQVSKELKLAIRQVKNTMDNQNYGCTFQSHMAATLIYKRQYISWAFQVPSIHLIDILYAKDVSIALNIF